MNDHQSHHLCFGTTRNIAKHLLTTHIFTMNISVLRKINTEGCNEVKDEGKEIKRKTKTKVAR